MIKRVNSTINEESFMIEFSNETHNYTALVPGQRDFIVTMIKIAMEEALLQ